MLFAITALCLFVACESNENFPNGGGGKLDDFGVSETGKNEVIAAQNRYSLRTARGEAQGESREKHLERLNAATDDMTENAKEAIKKLSDIITGSVNSAVGQLQKLLGSVMLFAEEIIGNTTKKLAEIADGYLGKVKELKEGVDQTAVDISQCIGKQEEVIKNLPKQLVLDLISCVTNKIKEGITIVTKGIDAILKIPNIITDLLKNVEDCKGGIVCLGIVTAGATAKMVSIPITIATQVAAATEFVATVEADVVLCGGIQVLQAVQKYIPLPINPPDRRTTNV